MLDAHETARRLGVHRQTISRYVVRGQLCPEGGRGHGKQFFSEEEIERFLAEESSDDCYWWAQEGVVRGRYRKRRA